MKATDDAGFSLIELLIVVAIIGIIAAIAIPQLMDAQERSRQRRTLGDMRTLVVANGTYFVDVADYAPNLPALQPVYVQVAVINDAWGTPFQYTPGVATYTLRSLGSDGAIGPAAPTPWINDPYEPDIVVTDGQFVQSPSS